MTLANTRIAIVTGAASGMGRATAHLFADEGALVVVADRDAEGVERVVSEIAEAMAAAGTEVIGCSPSPLKMAHFAAACDLRICSEDSIFRMPAARLGLVVPVALALIFFLLFSTFGSVRHLGETARAGTWVMQVSDRQAEDVGRLIATQVVLHGH